MSTTSTVDLSKGAIRERSVQFAKRWESVKSESAEKQTFWNELLEVFGIDRRQVAAFEELAKRASTGNIGWIDLLYPGQMAVEHKSAGGNLDNALGQLFDYLPSLHKAEFPWLLIVSDFEHFTWRNLDTSESGEFSLVDLPHNLEIFWWMAGHGASPFAFEDEEQANLVATSLMAQLHDELLMSGYDSHALREWLTRVLFCLFADDTDVWDRAGFHTYVARYTHIDGHDLGPMIAQLFQVLDTPPDQRAKTLDEDLRVFTYINGDLFANQLPMPSCNEAVRNALLEACKFDWGVISPSIFGSMFQNVMQPAERRQLGAHYTTEQNILRTIRPLFVDTLSAELAVADTRSKIERFLDKLPNLKFFDPACGCGNFLVIAYREIRRLETEALRQLDAQRRRTGQQAMNIDLLCKVNVAQFFGIEIEEFPARIARTALYLTDHIANREISAEFGQLFIRFPIPASPHILIANALRMDWNDLLRGDDVSYVFGNPPFVGRQHRTDEQTEDQQIAMSSDFNGYLDYVTSWFSKATRYLDGQPGHCAFVATNSICQGEQVSPLWEPVLARGFTIDFAYRTFAWTSEARGTAAVHVVIVGISQQSSSIHRLFNLVHGEMVESRVSNINPYLAGAPSLIVKPLNTPLLPELPRAAKGSKPTDGGHLLVEEEDFAEVAADPVARNFLRPAIGARVMLHSERRYCLWLEGATPNDIRSSRILSERLSLVKQFRAASRNARTRMLAERPAEFDVNAQPTTRYLCLPAHSSENRRTIPMAFFGPETIVLDSALSIAGATDWLFALLQSSMFTAWLSAVGVGGRLKSDYRIAPDLVYNTFPVPALDDAAKTKLTKAAQDVLEARATYPESSLADLYDSVSMPSKLVDAHNGLDKVVDSVFAPNRRFGTEADRLALLFERYQTLVTVGTLEASAPRPTRRRSTT